MLQNIRDKMQSHKWLTYLVLGALALVFSAWGAYGIVNEGFGTADYAAKVNGEKIPLNYVNELWQQQQPRLLQAAGGSLTDEQRKVFQDQLLEDEIRAVAVRQYAEKMGFRVSGEQLTRAFRSEPSFQVDGTFSIDEARSRLAQAGMTERAYYEDLKRSLLVNQLLGSVGVSDFLTAPELQRVFTLLDEEREVRYVMLEPESFAGTNVDAAVIEAWYKEHAGDYMQREYVQLAYAELSLADVAAVVQVTEKQLQDRYERDKAGYVTPETRRARHILIAVDGTTDDAKAAAQARDLYEKIRGGADFATLAKQNSKDTASAAKGGELDWAGREVYVKEFSDKLFSMKQGEVSEPVKTQFGYHILKLEGVRAESGRSFEQVRGEIAASLRNELAGAEFTSREDRLQERLDRGGATLEQLVREFSLRRGEVAQFERGAGGLPLGSDADLNQSVFSDAVLTQGRVGGPVALGEDRITIFQVIKHYPAAQKPLEQVRADVIAAVRKEQGGKAALAAAETAVAALGAGGSFDKVAAGLRAKVTPARFVGRNTPDLPVEVRSAVFAAVRPVAGKPQHQVVKMDGAGAALVEILSARTQPLPDNPQLMQLRGEREQQRYSRRNADSYVAEVLKAAKIRRNPQAFQ